MERATGTMSNTLDDYAGDHMWIRNNYFYNEIHIAHLTSENVTLHDISYGKAAWIVRSEYGSSDEVMIQGQPVKRSKYVYCHCGQCDWSWYLRGWQCWYDDVYYDCLTTERLALHDLMTGEARWVAPYDTGNASSILVNFQKSSVSIETVSTETKLRIYWNRSGLEPCPCGRCQLHWFQYGWKCWPVQGII